MRKWDAVIEFLRKFENRSIKIARVICYHQIYQFTIIYFNFVRLIVVRCDLRRFSVLSPFIEKTIVIYIYVLWRCTTCHLIAPHYIQATSAPNLIISSFNLNQFPI